MKNIFIIFFLCSSIFTIAQKNTPIILSTKEVNQIVTDSTKSLFNITYPIFRVYQYEVNKLKQYLVLTESMDEIKAKDTLSKNLKALVLKEQNGELNKEQEINDNIIATLNEEYTISFWTKYTSLEQINSVTVPIIVYGTQGMNKYGDGRIKIVIIYNNQKIQIRHQNAVLDGERLTQIDKAFYKLPVAIQNTVRQKIKNMEKSEHAILAYGWDAEMKKKKLEIKD